MESKSKELLEYVTADGKCPFDEWLKSLKDIKARALIRVRFNRIILGNFGDCKAVGEGVSELRIYFGQDGATLMILLCVGSKKSQRKDIDLATKFWSDYLRRKNE
jgi:putative addiction module killer protein